MSQDQALMLALKVTLVAGAVSVAVFITRYHQLTRGAVWRDKVGQTIVVKDVLLALMLLPTILSLFFHFSRLTSRVAAWTDVTLFALLPVVMIWRTVVFQRIHDRAAGNRDGEPPEEGAP